MQYIYSFFVSGSVAVLNNVQKKYVFLCGLSGVLTYLSYSFFSLSNNAAISSLLSCLILSFYSQFLCTKSGMPSIIFIVPGIMPIVPGSLMFKSFNFLIDSKYNESLEMGLQAILVGFAIAIGLLLNETISYIINSMRNK